MNGAVTESLGVSRMNAFMIQLAEKIKAFQNVSDHPPFQATRLVIPIPSVDPLDWLNQQKSDVKSYWSSRDKQFEMAAVGMADCITAKTFHEFPHFSQRLKDILSVSSKGVRYYGGYRFSNSASTEMWEPFGSYYFYLPRFELIHKRGKRYLACNVFLKDSTTVDQVLAELEEITFSSNSSESVPLIPTLREDDPGKEQWHTNIYRALASFDVGEMEKIVLARKSTFSFDHHLNPLTLLQKLQAGTPQCFHFCFQPQKGTAFVGASPERLYRRTGQSIESEAVAGTRPRGQTRSIDTRLAQELLDSDKELREHCFVRDSIRDLLEPLCESLNLDADVSLIRLARGQHLFTGFHGSLKAHVTDQDLLHELHPTPAVGGCPTEKAIQKITEWENFDRGWYAAPIGWIGRDSAEFAVAIRSGLINGDQLSLFSGAGIVQGSTPEREWSEIENKIGDFIKLLTGT
ncbi:MAG: isochorismate synthase [Kiritimatiellae bacterium]|nr:isochorismate synthase [Kiritimatiellia bacterium]